LQPFYDRLHRDYSVGQEGFDEYFLILLGVVLSWLSF